MAKNPGPSVDSTHCIVTEQRTGFDRLKTINSELNIATSLCQSMIKNVKNDLDLSENRPKA